MTLNELKLLWPTLSPFRLWNGILLTISYVLSRATGRNYHAGMPVALSFEPTTSCNLRCPHCPSGLRTFSRETGMLHTDLFETVIEEVAPHCAYLTLYFQGEPYLNKDFLHFVRLAAKRKMYTVTSTNAHYLNPEQCEATVLSGLSKLIISIDGTTQNTYAHYRVGGKLEKVLEGTKALIEAKNRLKSKTPFIEWQFVVFRHNEHQLSEVKSLARTFGVDRLSIKTAQIYDFDQAEQWLPENDALSRYEYRNGSVLLKNKLLNHCWKMWHSCVITWDGKVVPCCFDKDAKYRMGVLPDVSFREVWRGSHYRQFRDSLLKSRGNIDICRNCTEGTRIWAE